MVQLTPGTRLSRSGRLPWTDQFSEPEIPQLLNHLDRQTKLLLETAREMVAGRAGVDEQLAWHGLPWRWTLVYLHPEDPTRALAYLVPDPQAPKISVPLTPEMVQKLPLKRMKKLVRDGIELGNQINTVIWACWDITSEAQLEEILDIVQRKHAYIQETAC